MKSGYFLYNMYGLLKRQFHQFCTENVFIVTISFVSFVSAYTQDQLFISIIYVLLVFNNILGLQLFKLKKVSTTGRDEILFSHHLLSSTMDEGLTATGSSPSIRKMKIHSYIYFYFKRQSILFLSD